MKNKIIFIVLTTASTFLFGKYFWNNNSNSQIGEAYAQVKTPDEKTEKKTEKTEKLGLKYDAIE